MVSDGTHCAGGEVLAIPKTFCTNARVNRNEGLQLTHILAAAGYNFRLILNEQEYEAKRKLLDS